MALDPAASGEVPDMLKRSGIYEILNTTNGKRYIGQAADLKARWVAHRKLLRGMRHTNKYLQAAWNKYGAEVFKFRVILTCTVSMLDFYEQQLLDKELPEYNIARDVVSPGRGRVMPLKEREALSERMKGNKFSLGVKHPPEHYESRAVLMLGNTRTLGFKHTAEFCEKQSLRMKGNTFCKGKNLGNKNGLGYKHTLEQSLAKSLRQLGAKKRPHTPEACERISRGMKAFRQGQRDAAT